MFLLEPAWWLFTNAVCTGRRRRGGGDLPRDWGQLSLEGSAAAGWQGNSSFIAQIFLSWSTQGSSVFSSRDESGAYGFGATEGRALRPLAWSGLFVIARTVPAD